RAAAGASTARKTVYLTFDDGPSAVTPKVLEILRREGVKATFFVLGDQAKVHPVLINAIREQGNAIGNHTYNHNYKDLYSGFTHFWSQIKRTEETIRQITGERPQLVRAPGGTAGHFDDTYFHLMKQAGYLTTDWTADSGDSERKGVPAAEILKNSVRDTRSARVVLLLHDGSGHEESAKALPKIIERYKAAGYVFKTLDGSSVPVQFKARPGKGAKARAKPGKAWIAANIAPNAALFAPGQPLAVEAGKAEAVLQPGEYRMENGRYI
ncbi:polysaccharide deacetylase family protein, partial [Paenibacillus forsythiae]|uniref:polysaccharide deacetylase family protein n=1 Tax=Paenibacillus forsythiae TaxID=365616 RepID=UPI00046EA736